MSGMDSQGSPVFWTALLFTWAACAAVLARAVLRPRALTEFPVFAGAMWLYFYGIMALGTGLTLSSHLPDWALDLGQVMALLCLVSLVAGWQWGSRRPAPAPGTTGGASPRAIWAAGIGLILVGGASFRLFIAGGDPDWEGTSAYWYLLFHVTYPGLALALAAAAMDPRCRGIARQALLAGLALWALFPHLATARRGPLFPAVVAAVLVAPLVARITPSRTRVLGGLAAASTAMLLFVAVRPWLYDDGKAFREEETAERWQQALEEVTLRDVFMSRAVREGDNEFLYHCALVATIAEREAYQYGSGYLSLLTHWIPRQWWPEKPELGRGFFPDAIGQVPLVVGWSMSKGASAGGVAEVFNQFGFASPLFWLAFGFGIARLHARARAGDLRWQLAYVGLVCASHWLVSQGVAAAFVPACIYVVVPLVVLRLARVSPARVAPPSVRRPSLA